LKTRGENSCVRGGPCRLVRVEGRGSSLSSKPIPSRRAAISSLLRRPKSSAEEELSRWPGGGEEAEVEEGGWKDIVGKSTMVVVRVRGRMSAVLSSIRNLVPSLMLAHVAFGLTPPNWTFIDGPTDWHRSAKGVAFSACVKKSPTITLPRLYQLPSHGVYIVLRAPELKLGQRTGKSAA
jgi:hypothetical protein